MKQFISNSQDIYSRITSENDMYYICGNVLYLKTDILIDYYPLDNLYGILHLHIIPFYN